MKFKIIIGVVLALSLTGQTRPKASDLKTPTTISVNLFGFINSKLVNVNLGPGLQINPPTTAGGPYILQATGTSSNLNWSVDNFVGTLICTLSAIPSVDGVPPIVTKNGVVQQAVVDYILSGRTITFTPAQGIASDDTIQVRYQF